MECVIELRDSQNKDHITPAEGEGHQGIFSLRPWLPLSLPIHLSWPPRLIRGWPLGTEGSESSLKSLDLSLHFGSANLEMIPLLLKEEYKQMAHPTPILFVSTLGKYLMWRLWSQLWVTLLLLVCHLGTQGVRTLPQCLLLAQQGRPVFALHKLC